LGDYRVRLSNNNYINLGINISAGSFSPKDSLLVTQTPTSIVAGSLASVAIIP